MGTVTNVEYRETGNFSTTSSTYVDITNATITLQNTSGGKALVIVAVKGRNTSGSEAFNYFQLQDDGVAVNSPLDFYNSDQTYKSNSGSQTTDTNGSVMKMRAKTSTGTLWWLAGSSLHALELVP